MKGTQRSQTQSLPIRYHARSLTWLFLLLLSAVGVWELQPPAAQGQTPGTPRFTGSLKLQEIEPGIEYGQTTSGSASKDETTGPWLINVLRIDLDPYNDRAEFGLVTTGSANEVIFGHLKFTGEISVGSAKHPVQGLNRPLLPDELIIFTPAFHRTSLTNPDGIEVVVRKNRVVASGDLEGSTSIPSDGFVISAVGKSREWLKRHVRIGTKLVFSWCLNSIEPGDDPKWRRAYSILGAGPQLIKAGKIAITDKQEKMAAGFAADRHPRTAIARLVSGKVVLITVDGRQPGISVGMSLEMLADLLLDLGAVDAMNLDGGGSTTMVIHKKIVNRPSDQTGERPVRRCNIGFSQAKLKETDGGRLLLHMLNSRLFVD